MMLVSRFSHSFERILTFFAGAACVIFLGMIASICAEIVMRYFLNRPLTWVVGASEFSLLFIVFLAAAWVLKGEGHVTIDIIVSHLRPRTQAIIGAIGSILGAVICLLIMWYGAEQTWDQYVRGLWRQEPPHFPYAPISAVIPIGSFLLVIQFLRRTYKYFNRLRAPTEQQQRFQGEP